MTTLLGYAHVSTADQDLEVQRQRQRLREQAGVLRVFEDVISGRTFARPGLQALLDYARVGDALCSERSRKIGG